MENITTEVSMNKLDKFQVIFGKVDKFGLWDTQRVQNDAGTQFTSKEFQEGVYVHRVRLALAAPEHQEMNGQVEVPQRKLQTIALSIMVHTRVSDEYIHFSSVYTKDHILPVISINTW